MQHFILDLIHNFYNFMKNIIRIYIVFKIFILIIFYLVLILFVVIVLHCIFLVICVMCWQCCLTDINAKKVLFILPKKSD